MNYPSIQAYGKTHTVAIAFRDLNFRYLRKKNTKEDKEITEDKNISLNIYRIILSTTNGSKKYKAHYR